jgi:hypothetical protein
MIHLMRLLRGPMRSRQIPPCPGGLSINGTRRSRSALDRGSSGLPPLASPLFFPRTFFPSEFTLQRVPSEVHASACPARVMLEFPLSALTTPLSPLKIRSGMFKDHVPTGGAPMSNWPDWWSWEIELSTHLKKRMLDRKFNETDIRVMLDDAESLSLSREPGRWIATTHLDARIWKIVVEPVASKRILVVVTAYRVLTRI